MKKTQEELAAEAAEALAAQAAADKEAADKVAADTAAAATAAAAEQAAQVDAAATAVASERVRVAGIFAAAPAGFEAARDEAIQSGSSVKLFQALVEASIKGARAENIADDAEANAGVAASTGKVKATGDDAAVAAILAAGKLANR